MPFTQNETTTDADFDRIGDFLASRGSGKCCGGATVN
jgi:hypothetical protein